MEIYKIDRKHNFIDIKPTNLDDLWTLNLIVKENDKVGSKTTRRFRVEGSKDSEKKTVYIKIDVEKISLDLKHAILKLTGKIVEGKPAEYVDIGSYHSFDIAEGKRVSISKTSIQNFEIKMLKESEGSSMLPNIYLLVLDDESSLLAKVNSKDYKLISEIKSGKGGKRLESLAYRNKYFTQIYESLSTLNKDVVVVAGPGFEKEYFEAFIKNKSDASIFKFTHINSTGKSGINELLHGGSIENILKEFSVQKDTKLIDELFKEIAKERNATYGKKHIDLANKGNAIKELLITDSFFMDNYDYIRRLIKNLESKNASFHIIPQSSDAGAQLNSLGGIAGILYYSLDS